MLGGKYIMNVTLKNEYGTVKQCKIGFSWTTFLFGFFVPLFRGDFKWTLIILALNVLVGLVSFGIGAFLVNMCFCFFYNKLYINDLLSKGYKPASEVDENILKQRL